MSISNKEVFAKRPTYRKLKITEEWDPTKINNDVLLQEIKKHPFIYNPNHTNYRDRILKRTVWDRICQTMYPHYHQCKEAVKLHILSEMHRRWMLLRCNIRREVKIIVKKGMRRKTVRPEISQLLFLIPYIQSPDCQKLTEKWGIQRLPNDNEMLALAEYEEHPPSNQQQSLNDEEETKSQDNDDIINEESITCKNPQKRQRPHDPIQAQKQLKLLDYLTKYEKRQMQQIKDTNDENDHDRMFLLSLVEDFKRIPANKKIYVKAKIATALTQATVD